MFGKSAKVDVVVPFGSCLPKALSLVMPRERFVIGFGDPGVSILDDLHRRARVNGR